MRSLGNWVIERALRVYLGMPRDIRYLPRPGATVEITQRTIQGRFLLKPSKRLNALVVGCLARAQKNTAADVHAVAAMSNHMHLLASFQTVEQMARFMGQLKTNLSKEIGRLHDWQGSMFDGRYKSIPLSDEPEVQVERLRYILSQGTKEGLVLSPFAWPGVHAAKTLAKGKPLRGLWIDRTKLYAARQTRRKAREKDFTSHEELRLTPLPCWSHLDDAVRRERALAMIREIEAEALAMHRSAGTAPLGLEAIHRRSPRFRPCGLARSPRPRFHAATKTTRDLLLNAYREFLIAYRAAAERLVAGHRRVAFPDNCYPPGLPFVEPTLS